MSDREFTLPPNADSDGPPDIGRALRVAVKADGVDLSLLDDRLAKSPGERMLANDDAPPPGECRVLDIAAFIGAKEAMNRDPDQITVKQLEPIKNRISQL